CWRSSAGWTWHCSASGHWQRTCPRTCTTPATWTMRRWPSSPRTRSSETCAPCSCARTAPTGTWRSTPGPPDPPRTSCALSGGGCAWQSGRRRCRHCSARCAPGEPPTWSPTRPRRACCWDACTGSPCQAEQVSFAQPTYPVVRRAVPADVRTTRSIVEPYAEELSLLAKDLVDFYEAVPEFLVAEDPGSGQVVGCGALHVMWEDLGEV